MKPILIKFLIFTFLMFSASGLLSQNAKKLYKSGKEMSKIGNYDRAIELYSEAINISPKYTKAIEERALSYEATSNFEKAAEDYETLSEIELKKSIYFFKAGSLYHKVEKYKKAIPLLKAASELEPNNIRCYYLKSQCNLALKNYPEALKDINSLLAINQSADNYFQRGLIYLEMNNYTDAKKDLKQSITLGNKDVAAFNKLAYAQLMLDEKDEAIQTLTDAIQIDNKNKTSYLLRSHIYSLQAKQNEAIEDLTKLLSVYPDDTKGLLHRGFIFYENKQYEKAIEDLSKVIEKEEETQSAIEKRAQSYEALNKKQSAASDYKKMLALVKKDNNDEAQKKINSKLFELQREKKAPELFIVQEHLGLNKIEVPEGPDEVSIKIKVIDQNDLLSIKIDGQDVVFDQDLIKKGQDLNVEIVDKNSISFEITDIYDNKTSETFTLIRKDTGLPRVVLTAPLSTKGNKIYINSQNSTIDLKGRIIGKHKIRTILINDIPADFNNAVSNPAFSATVKIEDINVINFDIVDIEGNHLANKFIIDRSDANMFSDNPMGRTWVVFIENSDYKEFTSLEAPKKEVDLMVKALAKYKIDKIIHKRNMTKGQMDNYFKYELKKQIIENRVNSIMLWYSGHGKFLNQSGYWIPVDSKVDDLSTYYNLNTLKTVLKPYTDIVTHSLIVTDACESGPSFYMSMRSLPSDKDCNNTKSTRFKSSQVFTSSGSDISNGDSDFTKVFANSLIYNSKSCIPIERIVNIVSLEIAKTSNARPKFGKISGFPDENGTFIFIKK